MPLNYFSPKIAKFQFEARSTFKSKATFPSWWKGVAINFNIENYWPNEIIFGKDVEHEWGWGEFLAIFLNFFLIVWVRMSGLPKKNKKCWKDD
jgi:hypothetical protein